MVDTANPSDQYSDIIEKNAAKFGYKGANLMNLQELIGKFQESLEGKALAELYNWLKIKIPEFVAVDGKIIEQHLVDHADGWRDKYEEYVNSCNNQENSNNIGKETINASEELQSMIIKCFDRHPLPEGILAPFFEKLRSKLEEEEIVKKLAIRSSTRYEDGKSIANPGGNESVPSLADNVSASKALGVVIASYFSIKSRSQYNIAKNSADAKNAKDENIPNSPSLSFVIQALVEESKEESIAPGVPKRVDQPNGERVVSGVLYSSNGSSRIQSAPGHGEYVVNSKGAVDNYYISEQNIVYAEVRPKEFRLRPEYDEESRKTNLVRVENSNKLQYDSSLTEPEILYLHEFGKFLEKEYGTRMDIEFVCKMDAKGIKTINIVQARAIPYGSRKALEPSALSPEFISKNKDNLTTIKAGGVITPEVNKAAVITNKEQLIITQNIEQALSEFLKLGKDAGAKIKGVIVQNPAPDTSHEAGVFNASAISVMQVKNIVESEKLINNTSPNRPLIMDPQHSKIHLLPKGLIQTEGKSREQVEAELYERQILAKGIFASPLSSFVTPLTHYFPKVDNNKIDVDLSLLDKSLGEILSSAKGGDIHSTKVLFSIAHTAMAFGQEEKPEASLRGSVATTAIQGNINTEDRAQILHQNLELLSTPKIGKSNEEAKIGLGYSLRALMDGYKKGIVDKSLFKQAMIFGAEIYVLLNNLEKTDAQNLSKEEKDIAYLSYFNSKKKFEGLLITGKGESLKKSLFNNKWTKIVDPAALQIKDESKAYLIESLKLSDYFLNDQSKSNWQEFCAQICMEPKNAQRLGELVNKAVTYNAHSKWVNIIFTDEYEKEKGRHPQDRNGHPELDSGSNTNVNIRILDRLEQAFKETDLDSIEQARKIIKTMESQIPMWTDPAKYEKLHKELQENLQKLTGSGKAEDTANNLQNPLLKWDKDANNLQKILVLELNAQLTDVMDKSIKSLQRSGLYQDEVRDDKGNILQVARMFEMVKEMYGVMVVGAEHTQLPKQHTKLINIKQFLTQKGGIILNKNEFTPSANFAVNAATLNVFGNAVYDAKTLEDIFTLMHQNLMIINSEIFTQLLVIVEKQYENILKVSNSNIDNNITVVKKKALPSNQLEFTNDKFIITKNIALGGHSCTTKIKYDYNTKKTFIEFNIFGGNEHNRWGNSALDSTIMLLDLKCTQRPYYDKNRKVMKFEVIIERDEQITQIINLINKNIAISFMHIGNIRQSATYINNAVGDRVDYLSKLFEKQPKLKSKINSINFIDGINFNFQEYKDIKQQHPKLANLIIKNAATIGALDGDNFSFKEFKQYFEENPTLVINFFNSLNNLNITDHPLSLIKMIEIYKHSADDIEFFMNNGFKIQELIKADSSIANIDRLYYSNPKKWKFFIKNGDEICSLIKSQFCDLNKLNELYESNLHTLEFFIKNAFKIGELTKSQFYSSDEIKKLYESDFNSLEFFLNHSSDIAQLINIKAYSSKYLKQLHNVNLDKFNFFIKNSNGITSLIIEQVYSSKDIDQMYNNDSKDLKFFLSEGRHIYWLLECNFCSLNELKQLYESNPAKLNFFIENCNNTKILITYSIYSPKDLHQMYDADPEKCKIIVEKGRKIIQLIDNKTLSKDELSRCNKLKHLELFLENKITLEDFKKGLDNTTVSSTYYPPQVEEVKQHGLIKPEAEVQALGQVSGVSDCSVC